MSNPRWALIATGIQFFVFWWLMSDAAEGNPISAIPGSLLGLSVLLTLEGWLKLDRMSWRKAFR